MSEQLLEAPELKAPEDYRVELDSFCGPLDLLLFLVRRHEIDLHDIPVAELTDQYLQHLRLMQRIDVNVAGEFLVMAATLLEIKSALLLPQAEADEEAAPSEPLDPRFELVQQLLAYKRFKDAAYALDDRRHDWEARYALRPGLGDADAQDSPPVELDLEDVHVLDLCRAFAQILDSIGSTAPHEVVYDDTPVSLHAEDIVDRLTREGPMTLQAIFVGRLSRSELIGLFLATLELVRQKRVAVRQDEVCGPIRLELMSVDEQAEADLAPRDWRNEATGEIEYDWPTEESRQRAERRARHGAARSAPEAAGPGPTHDTLPV